MKLSKIKKWEMLKHMRMNSVGKRYGSRFVLQLLADEKGRTSCCPFCGKEHQHGAGTGHQVSHCSNDIFGLPIDKSLVFQNDVGQLFFLSDGYELCARND